ncbi:MAG: DUF6316 family protein [Gammaproteobacteria bacterium]|nr:DUF6316 family protein [Gammaproteobacteria bacterium]
MTNLKADSRKNENKKSEPRIERTFNINKLWYFEVRGGGQQGPFDSEEQMKSALEEFIKLQQECCTSAENIKKNS